VHLSLLAHPTRRQANLSQIIGIAAFAAAFRPEPIDLSLSTLYQARVPGKMPRTDRLAVILFIGWSVPIYAKGTIREHFTFHTVAGRI
jgi:hypothetical protein